MRYGVSRLLNTLRGVEWRFKLTEIRSENVRAFLNIIKWVEREKEFMLSLGQFCKTFESYVLHNINTLYHTLSQYYFW